MTILGEYLKLDERKGTLLISCACAFILHVPVPSLQPNKGWDQFICTCSSNQTKNINYPHPCNQTLLEIIVGHLF
jgi:hypothetical protein